MKSLIKNSFAFLFQLLPENNLKNYLRKLIINFINSAPKFLFINKNDVVVIIGTPNPERVHTLVKLTGEKGKVVIFEPENKNYNLLNETSECYHNVIIDQVGAWSTAGNKTLLIANEKFPGDHKIPIEDIVIDNDYRPENYIDKQNIDVDTLDNLQLKYNVSTDFIEIMVNGAELEVLKGAAKILNKERPRLWIKGHARDTFGKAINIKICKFLEKYNYNYFITQGGKKTVAEINNWKKRSGDVFAWPRKIKKN